MQTQSHLLLTVFLGHRLRRRIRAHLPALALGSIAPDLPLYVLTVWFFLVPRRAAGPGAPRFGSLYDAYFFDDPVWIVLHNALHAPFALALLALAGRAALRSGRPWGVALLSFTAACAFHTLVDTFTHHNDGPLLLFPFDWSWRFRSPVSYWHPEHYGLVVQPLELGMDAAIGVYLVAVALSRRRRRGEEALAEG